jgi:hypothetical protein
MSFASLGPGLITGAPDDDPSGISTYSVAGAACDGEERLGRDFRFQWGSDEATLFIMLLCTSSEQILRAKRGKRNLIRGIRGNIHIALRDREFNPLEGNRILDNMCARKLSTPLVVVHFNAYADFLAYSRPPPAKPRGRRTGCRHRPRGSSRHRGIAGRRSGHQDNVA